jgi:hypothetical protein
MKTNRFVAAAAALFIAVLPARSDQILGAGRIDNSGNVTLSNGVKIGKSNGTGLDLSGMSATPTGSGISVFLSDILAALRPHAATNAALKTSGTWFSAIRRNGFYAQGDGGVMDYTWSPTNCSAADDGAQVQPTGRTGCWVADLPSMLRPEAWGAQATGTFDDGPAIRAACRVAGLNIKQVAISKNFYINSKDPAGNAALYLGVSGNNGTAAPSCDIIGTRTVQLPDNASTWGVGLYLGAGVNLPLIGIAGNTKAPLFQDLFLGGNKGNQTGWAAGPAVGNSGGRLCTVNLETSTGGVESGLSMTRVVMRDGYNCNFFLGGNRGSIHFNQVWSQYSGQVATDFANYIVGYDTTFDNYQVGSNVGGGTWYVDGGQHQVNGGASFLNGGPAIQVNGLKVNYLSVTNYNLASNAQQGIKVTAGAAYSGQSYGGYIFDNVTFDNNSTAGNGLYSDVYVDTAKTLSLVAPNFVGAVIQANTKPNYNIEVVNGATVSVVNPVLSPGGANVSGFTNNCALISGNFPVTCNWTPVFRGDTAGTPTYSRQFGSYTRSANTITAAFQVDLTNLGGATGNAYLSGLPVPAANVTADFASCTLGGWGGWTAPTGKVSIGGIVPQNQTSVYLYANSTDGTGSSPLTIASLAATARLYGTCTYRVAG